MGAAASTAAQPPPPSREDILESWLRVPLARRSQAVVAVETIVDEALEATQTYDVVVTLFGASSLPGTDGSRGTSDPYVVLKVGDATRTSDYIKNDENPNFSEAEYVFEDSAASTLEVSVFDKDWKTSDDVLGAVAVPLVGRGAQHTPLTLDLSTVRSLDPGNVTLSWHRAARAQPEGPDAPPIDAPAGAHEAWLAANLALLPPAAAARARADVAEAVEALAAPKRAAPEAAGRTATVVVTILRATNLFNDVRERSKSDPYAVVTLGVGPGAFADGRGETESVSNTLDPVFDAPPFTFALDAEKLGGAFLRVAFFDKDTNSADEGLGSTDVFLADAPQGPYVSGGGRTFALETLGDNMGKAQGSVTLSWVVEGLEAPAAPAPAPAADDEAAAPAPAPADEDPAAVAAAALEAERAAAEELRTRDREAAEARRLAAVAKEREAAEARERARKEASAKAAAEAKREAERAALARDAEAAARREAAAKTEREAAAAAEAEATRRKEEAEAKRLAAEAAAAKAPSEVVVRRELRAMKPADQRRFVNAIKKMMENPGGPGSSEYARVAGYHGWPGDAATGDTGLCAHRRESFPGWHRAYMMEVEDSLRRADVALGNDGRIGFPYWDSFHRPELNGEILPAIIRDAFRDMPEDLVDGAASAKAGQFASRGYSRVRSEAEVKEFITRKYDLPLVCDAALWTSQHFNAASTGDGKSNDDVESPHNYVHNAVGYPMTTTSFAAYHPIFFLHHCNVDRLYEAYLKYHPDSQREFASYSASRGDGEYDLALKPFVNPRTGKIYAHADCFDAAALGFAYDTLPKRRPQQLREPPDYALFRGLDLGLAVFQDAAYFLHVFVVPTEEAADFSPPLVPIPRDDHAYYAGSGSIFGGKGERCAHCASGKKVDVTVDVTRALRHELKRGRKDVVLFTLVVDANTDELVVLDADTTETLGIPLPELVGPWYAPGDVVPDLNEATDKAAPGAKDMTLQLQKMLKNFGYYEGEVDADFGEMTTQAVKTFQDVNKLLQDGVVGPKTLGILKKVRNDVAKDIGDRDEARVAAGQWLKYTVGPAPGYLDRRAILAEVDAAFGQWAAAGGFRAERVDDADDAKIAVTWAAPEASSFDGPGGSLARADATSVVFDFHEDWLLQGMKNRPGAFFFLPVMLHEVGHCLGLTHSAEYRDVMSPYYVANHANLTDNDVARLQKNLVL